ncbi:sulfotransferase [Neiella sp. HB171785]|uniref:Sulfotransferase n=1 Tax=Neiella litorisoli TaxID=2771431 RepID=A0A8J6QJZ0_9GAMM|nr:sulfotransferase [Neiella litorisoli]MBD1390549.1 sulfotransferase [Neiella litorisoli]
MRIADFFIIGAAKCGTTSLQSYLGQHPDIAFSRYKEPNFYALEGASLPEPGPVSSERMFAQIYDHCITSFDDYQQQFVHCQNDKVIGDASVRHLYYPEAAKRIAKRVPNAKLVAVLREPVSRLYSHYCMNKQYDLEPLSLEEALAAEPERMAKGWGWDWHYANVGMYGAQLSTYLQHFEREQMMFVLYDDYLADQHKIISDICRFLDVDDRFEANTSSRGKVPYWPRHHSFDRWLHGKTPFRKALKRRPVGWLVEPGLNALDRMNRQAVPKLAESVAANISHHFKEDVMLLEEILGRKVPWKHY